MADLPDWSFETPRRRDGIACPVCSRTPLVGEQWVCGPDGCGFAFDTFASRGRCPRCDAQFAVTWCPGCGKPSPHQAWYRAR